VAEFDLSVDLVLIRFEWPDSRLEKNRSFWEISTAFGVVGLWVVGVSWVLVSYSNGEGREGQQDRHGWA
jgi:hypothetical protein